MQKITVSLALPVLRTILTALLVVGLTGCAKIGLYNDYSVAPLSSAKSKLSDIKNVLKTELVNNDKFDSACFDATAATTTCKNQRNAATAGLMAVSDELCVEHVRSIFGNDAAYNLTFGTITNLFAGAATVAGTRGAKTLFSGIALFSNAERSLVNETVYKTMLATAISKKIREGRIEQRNTIVKHMREDTIEIYTMNEAISNVMEYHNTCSFMYGMEKTLEEGNQNGTELKKLALERQLNKLELEKKLREAELRQEKDKTCIDDVVCNGLSPRITALHQSIQALETPDFFQPIETKVHNKK